MPIRRVVVASYAFAHVREGKLFLDFLRHVEKEGIPVFSSHFGLAPYARGTLLAGIFFLGDSDPDDGSFPFASTMFTCGGEGLVLILMLLLLSWWAKISRPSSISLWICFFQAVQSPVR